MNHAPTSVKFFPVIPPGMSNSEGQINKFGQHKYVVLRKLHELGTVTRSELLTSLSMADAQALGALDKLIEAAMVSDDGLLISVTDHGAQTLAAL